MIKGVAGAGAMVSASSFRLLAPSALVAVKPMLAGTPRAVTAEGTPEITPVVEFNERPGGNGVAPNDVGLLLASMV